VDIRGFDLLNRLCQGHASINKRQRFIVTVVVVTLLFLFLEVLALAQVQVFFLILLSG
jgi:hypothetical protein